MQHRDRPAAATALLDRGFGKPVQAVDLVTIARKLHKLTVEELMTLEVHLMPSAAAGQATEAEVVH